MTHDAGALVIATRLDFSRRELRPGIADRLQQRDPRQTEETRFPRETDDIRQIGGAGERLALGQGGDDLETEPGVEATATLVAVDFRDQREIGPPLADQPTDSA